MSNQIVYGATFVAAESLLSPQLKQIGSKHFYRAFLMPTVSGKNFLSPHFEGLSPHVANGDRVGHRCLKEIDLFFYTARFEEERLGGQGCRRRLSAKTEMQENWPLRHSSFNVGLCSHLCGHCSCMLLFKIMSIDRSM